MGETAFAERLAAVNDAKAAEVKAVESLVKEQRCVRHADLQLPSAGCRGYVTEPPPAARRTLLRIRQ